MNGVGGAGHLPEDDREPIVLHALDYAPLPTPFRRGAALPDAVDLLGDAVGRAAGVFRKTSGMEFNGYAIGSTLNSPYTSDPTMWRDAYRARIQRLAGSTPSYSVNVYECTNWAFILRNELAKSRALGVPRQLLMQIVDADIHGLEVAWKTRTYGFARFGILTAALTVDGSVNAAPVRIGRAPPEHAMVKFSSTIRQAAEADPGATVCLPFFPQPTREAFRRSVRHCNGLPDLHDEFGHCFGADPWISLGLHREHAVFPRHYLVSSLALNGYYAVGRLRVVDGTRIRIGKPS